MITRVGGNVTSLRVGDEVVAITGRKLGGHAASVNVPVANAVRKPSNISFEDTCSLPVAFATVYHAFNLGNLRANEHVLIQTATGGCGLMAIQLACLKGAVCYGTSSRESKLDVLRELGIPHVMNYKTSEFDREIANITAGRGVDVVLNMLAGEGIQKGLNCLAPSGRYLELAVHALKSSRQLDLSRLVSNQSIHSIDLRQLSRERQAAENEAPPLSELLEVMVSMVQSETIVPIVSRIYPIHQIKDALAFVDRGDHIGKVVISHTREEMVDCRRRCIDQLLEQKARSGVGIAFGRREKTAEPELEGIAVIGVSGEFPGANTLERYWENIMSGADCVSEVPPSRWSLNEHYDPTPKTPRKTDCKWMGVLDNVDQFDPLFFQISPAEAEWIDPQQRLFLQNSWRCIEDAGLSPARLSGSRCGVFVGCGAGDYLEGIAADGLHAHGLMGRSVSILPARIAYLLNLRGPCMAIDTACSSSLVAINEACNSLVLRTCDLALAGGVSVLAGPTTHIMTSQAGMLSKDGRCFTFDARANGFVPGEGVGVVLLKRISDAIRDGDPIHGVIRGWGINQDGKTNGITAPSVRSQIDLARGVYDRFGIHPETISLIEAHGTGTKLGDPIEVEALTAAFGAYTNQVNFCALGSVKSNIGHLLTAAGAASVIKVLLAMKHRQLPPTIHFNNLNEHIELYNSPFYVNTECKPWDVPDGTKRRAAVSAFGFSGTNAHLVLEEHEVAPTSETDRPVLFVLSATNEERLKVYAERVAAFCDREVPLAELAYTFQVGRDEMTHRLAVVAGDRETLRRGLKAYVRGAVGEGHVYGVAPGGLEGESLPLDPRRSATGI